MQCLTLNFNDFQNKFLWRSSQIGHMAFKELPRLQITLRTNHFVDRTFRGFNWSPAKKLVKDSYPLINHSLIMQPNVFKKYWNFLQCLILNFNDFQKNFLKEFSDSTHGIQKLPRLSDCLADQSFCGSDILRIQLKFNWTVGERQLACD